jgi:hypothetical protein
MEQYPDSQWKAWKAMAHAFIFDCIQLDSTVIFVQVRAVSRIA